MRVALVCLGAALLLSLGANAWLVHRLVDEYLDTQRVRLDPLGLRRLPEELARDPASERDERRVVFFGDSRARAWTPPEALAGFEFVDRGIGGQTSAQALQRFDRHVVPLHPDVVVIQIGVNDLKLVSLLREDRGEIVEDCAENIERIVEEASRVGITVVLTTIIPLGEIPLALRPFYSDEVGSAIGEVNQRIRSLARPGVIVLDAAALLVDGHGRLSQPFAQDWLHVAPAGYRILNDELVRVLKGVDRSSGGTAASDAPADARDEFGAVPSDGPDLRRVRPAPAHHRLVQGPRDPLPRSAPRARRRSSGGRTAPPRLACAGVGLSRSRRGPRQCPPTVESSVGGGDATVGSAGASFQTAISRCAKP